MKLREMIDEIKSNSTDMLELTAEIAKSAAQGCAPDAEKLARLAELGKKAQAARAVLGKELGQGDDNTAQLPLDELEALVAERELRMRMCAAIAGRIEKAAAMLRGLDAPCGEMRAAGEIAGSAREMLERGDMDGLTALEQEAEPYLDMYALVRNQAEAMRADAGLIGRIERHYPQIAWYVRAQAGAACEAGFDDGDDGALDGLRTATSDESKMKFGGADSKHKMVVRAESKKSGHGDAPDGKAENAAAENAQTAKDRSETGAAPESAEADGKSTAAAGNSSENNVIILAQASNNDGTGDAAAHALAAFDFSAAELERAFNAPERVAGQQPGLYDDVTGALSAIIAGESEKTLAELGAEYPEFDGLKRLDALVNGGDGKPQRDRALAMLRRAALQAYICDDIRRDARRFLERNSPRDCRPRNINQAVMRRMVWRGTGDIACALEIIIERRAADYGRVTELYDRLMIAGSNNGVQLSRFEMYATQLWREEAANFKGAADKPGGAAVLNWLRMLNPALLIIGRWHALVCGAADKNICKK